MPEDEKRPSALKCGTCPLSGSPVQAAPPKVARLGASPGKEVDVSVSSGVGKQNYAATPFTAVASKVSEVPVSEADSAVGGGSGAAVGGGLAAALFARKM